MTALPRSPRRAARSSWSSTPPTPSYLPTRRCRRRERAHERALPPLRRGALERVHSADRVLAAGPCHPPLSLSVREFLPALFADVGRRRTEGCLQLRKPHDLLPEPDPHPRLLRDHRLQQPGHGDLLLHCLSDRLLPVQGLQALDRADALPAAAHPAL